jgi:hypothetical protein
MTRFRWITLCRALDVLEHALSNAQFGRLFEEYGFGRELDAVGGISLTTPKLHSHLLTFLGRDPTRLDSEGNLIVESMIGEAARHVPDPPKKAPWPSSVNAETPDVTAFRNSLAVDGWSVHGGVILPVAPVPIEEQRSRLREYLAAPLFDDARNRLDQLEMALDAGNWEAANGITRGFLAALFVAICQQAEPGITPREESDARKRLAQIGFFAPGRQADRPSPESEFVWKMSAMMGTEGVHAGASTQETAVFRYAIAVLTADYFLTRLRKGHL